MSFPSIKLTTMAKKRSKVKAPIKLGDDLAKQGLISLKDLWINIHHKMNRPVRSRIQGVGLEVRYLRLPDYGDFKSFLIKQSKHQISYFLYFREQMKFLLTTIPFYLTLFQLKE